MIKGLGFYYNKFKFPGDFVFSLCPNGLFFQMGSLPGVHKNLSCPWVARPTEDLSSAFFLLLLILDLRILLLYSKNLCFWLLCPKDKVAGFLYVVVFILFWSELEFPSKPYFLTQWTKWDSWILAHHISPSLPIYKSRKCNLSDI